MWRINDVGNNINAFRSSEDYIHQRKSFTVLLFIHGEGPRVLDYHRPVFSFSGEGWSVVHSHGSVALWLGLNWLQIELLEGSRLLRH